MALSALRREIPRAYAPLSLPAIESLLDQVRSTRLSRAEHPDVPVGVEADVSAPPPSKPKGRGRAASGGAPFVWNEGGVDTVVAFAGTLGVFDNHTNGTAVLAAMKHADMAPASLKAGRVETVVKHLKAAVAGVVSYTAPRRRSYASTAGRLCALTRTRQDRSNARWPVGTCAGFHEAAGLQVGCGLRGGGRR